METIVEPMGYIARLWSSPKIKENRSFRLMQYIIRTDYKGYVLLYNVVTGQLVKLNHEESNMINKLPATYLPLMKELVDSFYLVPFEYDEHEMVKSTRYILRKLDEIQLDHDITFYTILPTTGCNARCYYCFEKGISVLSMTKETAQDVVRFICSNCSNNKEIRIRWFGGEPTVASERIDQICSGLRDNGVSFTSVITTNGYLFDETMVNKAKDLWHLTAANITIDGIGENYNRIKNFVNPIDNPYLRIMHNIKLLLERKIHVQIRMNFDLQNYEDFSKLVNEIVERFGMNEYLHVFVHPINGEYPGVDGDVKHGSDEWFSKKIVELNDFSRRAGLYRNKRELPVLRFKGCMATDTASATITPDGRIVSCSEHIGDDQTTGTVKKGITNQKIIDSWNRFADYSKCAKCYLYPYCIRITNCSIKDMCTYKDEYDYQFTEEIIERFIKFNG